MNKHTQGEWRKIYHANVVPKDQGSDQCYYEIRSQSDKLIAKLPGWTGEDEANAVLIKAAPKMLIALEKIACIGRYNQYSLQEAIDIARAAFKEAQP